MAGSDKFLDVARFLANFCTSIRREDDANSSDGALGKFVSGVGSLDPIRVLTELVKL